VGAREVGAMRLVVHENRKGQSLIEYAMVAAIVSAAIIAMSTYVYRSVQATQQVIQEEFSSY
jgi:Flp pilus assembly pilin Flp